LLGGNKNANTTSYPLSFMLRNVKVPPLTSTPAQVQFKYAHLIILPRTDLKASYVQNDDKQVSAVNYINQTFNKFMP